MREFFKLNKVLNFVGMFRVYTSISVIAVLASLVLLMTKGLNYGVDFKGGAEVQVKFAQSVDTSTLRSALEAENINYSSVQSIGEPSMNEFLIKIAASDKNINTNTESVVQAINTKFADKGIDIRRTEIVGPKAGEELKSAGIWAMIWSMLGIMVYVGLRFDIKYAPGAVVALIHDVIVTLGVLVITQTEFNLQILGAILALIGYSINDTVVIYDRIREKEQSSQRKPIVDLMNEGLTETLGRTILTAGTTFTVCVVMFMLGGGVIHDFFFTLWVGIIAGTYSTLFVASPLVLLLYRYTTNRSWGKKTI